MQGTAGQAIAAQPKRKSESSGLGALALAVLIKGKTLLLAMVKLKYFLTIGSAVISVLLYARGFGLAGAIGFVALLFVHEMGHVIVLRKQGVPISAPLFIPFLGAIIGMKSYPKGVVEEAYSAIAGPVMGSIGALVCLSVYFGTGSQLWAWLAYVGFFLNLFNLIPMSPLDGGRVVGAVWRGFWVLGIFAACAMGLFLDSPIIFLFALFGLDEVNRRFMRVHWSVYALMGALSCILSFLMGDLLIGVLIGFLSFSYGKRARALHSYLDSRPAAPPPLMPPRVLRLRSASPYWHARALMYPGRNKLRRAKLPLFKRMISKPIMPPHAVQPEVSDAYFKVPARQRMIIGTMYVGLASILFGLLIWMHQAGLFMRPQG